MASAARSSIACILTPSHGWLDPTGLDDLRDDIANRIDWDGKPMPMLP